MPEKKDTNIVALARELLLETHGTLQISVIGDKPCITLPGMKPPSDTSNLPKLNQDTADLEVNTAFLVAEKFAAKIRVRAAQEKARAAERAAPAEERPKQAMGGGLVSADLT